VTGNAELLAANVCASLKFDYKR